VCPYGVEVTLTKYFADVSVERAKEARGLAIDGIAKDWEELIFVPGEQICIPLDADAKVLVEVAAHRDVTSEEDFEMDVRLERDAAQHRRLILDWVRCKIGKAKRAFGREC
jgi:hypothetical protein